MEEHPIEPTSGEPVARLDQSPEARRKRALRWRAGLEEAVEQRVGPGTKTFCVLSRVWQGTYNDGSIHAGNLAYMALLALFPFFITVAAGFAAFGEAEQTADSVRAFLVTLPPVVTRVIEPVAMSALEARSGWLLWFGGVIGMWTVSSLIETLRDILHRAYGTPATLAFWRYRLLSTGLIVASVVLLLLALFAQVLITAALEVVSAWFPALEDLALALSLSRLVPTLVLYGALFALFVTLTPSAYRGKQYPKWPGALFVTVWWALVTTLLPPALRMFFRFDLTYGSLAGVMIALFFFWLIGLGVVIGAELNAALTESPEERDMLGQADNRASAARREGRDVNDE
jgi:membrane protein